MKTLSMIFAVFAMTLPFTGIAGAQNQGGGTLNVKVTNTPLPVTAPAPLPVTAPAPLPVTVVPPAQPATVTCKLTLGAGSALSPFNSAYSGGSRLVCPQGTSSISLRRVIYDPDNGGVVPSSQNVAGYRLLLGIANGNLYDDPSPTLIAMLTEGAPEKTFGDPFLVNVNQSISFNLSCFSGIAGVVTTCGGVVYVVGTPQ